MKKATPRKKGVPMKKKLRRQQNRQQPTGEFAEKKKKHHKTTVEVDIVTRHVSPPAQGVLELIGTGMRLRVPHGTTDATVVDAYPNMPGDHPAPSGPVSADIVSELLASGLLHKMTRDRSGDRTGWAEAGLDGNAADFYSMVQ